MAAVTGSGDRVGRSLVPSATSAGTERPFRRQRSCSGAVKPRWRIWMRALTRAWRAERLATTSTRMASTAPSRDLGLPARPTAQCGPGGFDGIEWVGLAAASPLLSVGPVDLDDLDAGPAQVTGQTRAIRAGALHADLGDVAKALEPRRAAPGSRPRRCEKLSDPSSPPSGSRAAATWTSRCVSTPPVIPRAASTMVMVIPSLNGVRDGTAVPDRSDGRSGCW